MAGTIFVPIDNKRGACLSGLSDSLATDFNSALKLHI